MMMSVVLKRAVEERGEREKNREGRWNEWSASDGMKSGVNGRERRM